MLRFHDLELGADRTQFEARARDVSEREDASLREKLSAAAAQARAAADHWDFFGPARIIDRMLDNIGAAGALTPPDKTRLRCVAVARLALEYFRVEARLPPSVLTLYPEFMQRLARHLSEIGSEEYGEEFFAKDVRYALGITVPGGALQFDVSYHIGPKLILREIARTRSLSPGFAYLKAGGWGRWFNEHIDLRAMRDFNPDGWTDHCTRMAEVLALNPEILGIVGVGWFYDPAVAEVSPALGYIRQTQVSHGGFLVRIGTEPHHIQDAIYRSALRKRLYEEGKYLPTCYMMAWPRRAIINWAARVKTDPGIGFAAYAPAPVTRPKPVAPHLASATAPPS